MLNLSQSINQRIGGAGLHFDPVDQPDVAPAGNLNEQGTEKCPVS